MPQRERRFYVIREAGSGNHPVAPHGSPEEAHAEARRLARAHRGQTFLVVGVLVGYCMPEPEPVAIAFRDLDDDGIPF